jgi:hypothetical protein
MLLPPGRGWVSASIRPVRNFCQGQNLQIKKESKQPCVDHIKQVVETSKHLDMHR